MVGEEVVQESSDGNTLQEGAGKNEPLIGKADFGPSPHLDVPSRLALKPITFVPANQSEVDRRLSAALFDAGRSALGMPGTVDTFKAMLHRAGLTLVLA